MQLDYYYVIELFIDCNDSLQRFKSPENLEKEGNDPSEN